MIRLIFLLAISLAALLAKESKCPDHYNPSWFEEPSDELVLLLEEYFDDKNIPFLPKKKEIQKLGLKDTLDYRVMELPHSTKPFKEMRYPVTEGIWRYEIYDRGITTTHLLLKEHIRYSELDAINLYNGLMGSYWNDYRVTGYEMTLQPEDTRVRYKDTYFEFNIKIYGLKNDATNLDVTHTDIIFRDYTKQVNKFIKCKEQS